MLGSGETEAVLCNYHYVVFIVLDLADHEDIALVNKVARDLACETFPLARAVSCALVTFQQQYAYTTFSQEKWTYESWLHSIENAERMKINDVAVARVWTALCRVPGFGPRVSAGAWRMFLLIQFSR